MEVYKWRMYCETEDNFVFMWSEEEPTTCPNDTGHTITAGSAVVVSTVGEEQIVTTAQKDEFGNPKFAPTLDYSEGLTPKKQSVDYGFTVVQGQVTFCDIEITQQIYLRGGEGRVLAADLDNVHKDDHIEFWAIDKNDVLGMFSTLGYTVGEDVWYIKWFVKDYIMFNPKASNYELQAYQAMAGKSAVYPGMFLRIKIDATNNNIGNYIYRPRLYWYE